MRRSSFTAVIHSDTSTSSSETHRLDTAGAETLLLTWAFVDLVRTYKKEEAHLRPPFVARALLVAHHPSNMIRFARRSARGSSRRPRRSSTPRWWPGASPRAGSAGRRRWSATAIRTCFLSVATDLPHQPRKRGRRRRRAVEILAAAAARAARRRRLVRRERFGRTARAVPRTQSAACAGRVRSRARARRAGGAAPGADRRLPRRATA